MGVEWRQCASSVVSVAMSLPSMGYGLHGHDVEVTACLCYGSKPARDLEELGRLLEEALKPVDHRLLDEVIGRREARLEDLLEFVEAVLRGKLKGSGDGELCLLEARIPGRAVSIRIGL